MKFTLTYDGEVQTARRHMAIRKHARRREFHAQLRRLWQVNSLLSVWHLPIDERQSAPAVDVLVKKFPKIGGYEFVPLISRELSLEAAINFRILRPTEFKGESADPDNIIKILIDSLKMPQNLDDLPSGQPQQGETPFFVLLQDDGLLSKITSVSEELLQPITGKHQIERSDTRVLIDVYIRPNFPRDNNLIFFSDDFEVWNHQWASAFDGIRNWSNAELKSRTTQCIIRMRVASSNFRMQRTARRLNPASTESGEDYQTRMQQLKNEHLLIWNSGLRAFAIALREELQRRIFGVPPYPTDHRMAALDIGGMLAGHDAIGEAAEGLESLIRQLPY